MPGRWYSELCRVGAEQSGFITTQDVRELGGTPQVLVDMHRPTATSIVLRTACTASARSRPPQ